MIKTMLKSLREFKKPTFLTLALMVAEVLIDVLIPFYTADLVNRVKAGVPMNEVLVPGLMLVVTAPPALPDRAPRRALHGICAATSSLGFRPSLLRTSTASPRRLW